MVKLLGRNVKLPKRPPPRHRSMPKRSPMAKRPPRPPKGKMGGLAPKKKKPQYETEYQVVLYKHKKLKSFKGESGRLRANMLRAKIKEKDPESRVVIKSRKVPRGLF